MTLKNGTHGYAVIADAVFHEVCDEYGDELTTGEELYRKYAGTIQWGELPKAGTVKEIQLAAREAMRGKLSHLELPRTSLATDEHR